MKSEKIMELGLLEAMREDLDIPDNHTDTYYSDLYILYTEERWKWLEKNYKYCRNCKIVLSNVETQDWYNKRFIDIPFMNDNYKHERGTSK